MLNSYPSKSSVSKLLRTSNKTATFIVPVVILLVVAFIVVVELVILRFSYTINFSIYLIFYISVI